MQGKVKGAKPHELMADYLVRFRFRGDLETAALRLAQGAPPEKYACQCVSQIHNCALAVVSNNSPLSYLPHMNPERRCRKLNNTVIDTA